MYTTTTTTHLPLPSQSDQQPRFVEERERKKCVMEKRESPKVAHANLQLRSTNGQAKKKPSLARSLAHSKRLFERARFPAKRDPHPVCKVSCAQLGKERRKKVRPYQFSLSLILSRHSISLVKSVQGERKREREREREKERVRASLSLPSFFFSSQVAVDRGKREEVFFLSFQKKNLVRAC